MASATGRGQSPSPSDSTSCRKDIARAYLANEPGATHQPVDPLADGLWLAVAG
jgi:hypothetical protein